MGVRVDGRLSDCPLLKVCCRRCESEVLVRKGSWNQTSVQWNAEASTRCLQRRDTENVAAYSDRGVFMACSALADSIVDAVRHGEVPVVDEML